MNGGYPSAKIRIGTLELGGDQPLRIQSMCNTDTNDIEASVAQSIRMIHSGAELVRLTTQGIREVESLALIKKALRDKGYDTPLVADIHFRPELALKAARVVEKIRINPGNYLKGKNIDTLLPDLLRICREEGTAIRIGVNHGSLAPEIMDRFGDTPEGMVESAMQFLRICQREGMDKVVVSMKSSKPRIMIESVRLLARRMKEEGMGYPLHLGVTEAGDGTDGIIKSVVGLAPLLAGGLGDTIRVSLTGPPEDELPVARMIAGLFPRTGSMHGPETHEPAWDPVSYHRRQSRAVLGIGGGKKPGIISMLPPQEGLDLHPDRLRGLLLDYSQWMRDPDRAENRGKILLLEHREGPVSASLAKLNAFCLANRELPVLFKWSADETDMDPDRFRIKLAGELGCLLADGMVDAVWVDSPRETAFINDTLLGIFQASGTRITRTEYIACPSCGRTHFDISARLKEIRRATSHLTTLKIGVMGCIVNGPGEMADADYGYVGAARGRVTLYKGKKPVKKNMPEDRALDELIALIKEHGDWTDP